MNHHVLAAIGAALILFLLLVRRAWQRIARKLRTYHLFLVIGAMACEGCGSSVVRECGPCEARVDVPQTTTGCVLRGVCYDDYYCDPIPGCTRGQDRVDGGN